MKTSRIPKWIGLISVLLLIVGCLGLWALARTSGLPGHITDVARYSEIHKGFEGSALVRHFPEAIPADATNMRLDYLPRLMQGGCHLQLRLELPLKQVVDLRAHFVAIAKHQFHGGDTNDHANLSEGVPTTFFYTSGTDDRSFPSTYEIFVLDAQPGGSSEFEWNHGQSYGVAIDVSASEIVYWLEYW
jgi:hypothetical protein